MLKVFISYTSRDQLSIKLSQTLFTHLTDEGISVWLDWKRLQDGDSWHEKLTDSLHDSHAGIVLLTKEALESEWVFKEANWLKMRSDRWKDEFRTIFIFLNDLGLQHVNEAGSLFKSLELSQKQLIFCPSQISINDLSGRVIKDLIPLKQLWQNTLPEDDLINRIKGQLEKPDDRDMLLRLAKHISLKVDLGDFYPDSSFNKTLSRELARLMASSHPQTVANAVGMETDIIQQSQARNIVMSVGPFQIPGPGARRLAELVDDTARYVAVGVNASETKTARLYIMRATGSLSGWRQIPLTNVVDNPEEQAKDIAEKIRTYFVDQRYLKPEDKLEKILTSLKKPCVVIIPSSVTRQVLEQLQQNNVLKKFCFFFLSDKLTPSADICLDGLLVFLAPPFQEDAEQSIINSIDDALRDLENLYQQAEAFF